MLLFLISFLVLADLAWGLAAAFLAGVFWDLWSGRALGVSSLKFLAIAILVNMYKRKVRAASFKYLLPFTFVVLLLGEMGELGNWEIGEGLRRAFWGSLGMVPLFWVFSGVWERILGRKEGIRVN